MLTTAPTATFIGHSGSLAGLSLPQIPSPTSFISASEDRTARVWSIETGKCIKALRLQDGEPSTVTFFSEQSAYVSVGSNVLLYDLRAPELILTNPSRSIAAVEDGVDINCLQVKDGGEYLATADDEGSVNVLDLRTGRPYKRFRSKHDNVCLKFRSLISCGQAPCHKSPV